MEKINNEFLDSVTNDLNKYLAKHLFNKSLEELGITYNNYDLENILFSDIVRIKYLYKLRNENKITNYDLKQYLSLYENYISIREKLIFIRDDNQSFDSYYELLMDQYGILNETFSSLGLFSLKIEIDNLFNIDDKKYINKK